MLRAMSKTDILERLRKLGLAADALPTDKLSSATTALVCLPMYMVSNVHGWTDDRQFVVPLLNIHGLEAVRESYAIGAEKAELRIDEAHEKVLAGFLAQARPSDLLVYEYALETLRLFLAEADTGLAEHIRTRVAEMIVSVAQAAGKQLFGTGDKVSSEERDCIKTIASALDLAKSKRAIEVLTSLGVSAT
jgi:hypothetical protein